jgi:hypothetical protein
VIDWLTKHLPDVFVFFWPPIVACLVIGFIAGGRDRRVAGAAVGLIGGFILAVILVAFRGTPTVVQP